MAYKVYTDIKKRLRKYDYNINLTKEPTKQWIDGARDRYSRYRGTLRAGQVNKHGHRISTPTGTATIDALFASLTAVEVDMSVTAVGSGTRDEAYLAQSALRQEWRTSRVQRKCEPAIKDALITDIGWVKVLYEYEEHDELRQRDPEKVDAEIANIYQTANALGTPELPDPNEVASEVEVAEEVTIVDTDRIVIDYVPYESLRFDPFAKRVEDIRWLAQITKLTKDEIENNELWVEFMKTHKSFSKFLEVKPDSITSSDLINQPGFVGQDDDELKDEFYTIYEYWDLEASTFCIYMKDQDFMLFEGHNPFAIFPDKIDRSPFVPFILREDPEQVRGIADMRLIAPILDELDLYRSNLATYTDRYVPKTLAKNGAFTQSGKVAIQSREYGAVVELEPGHEVTDTRDISPPALPAELFDIPEKLENEIREATGVNELMRGIFPDRKRTATETQQVVASSAGRQAEKRNRLGESYRGIAKRILRLMQMFYDNERITRVVDEYGEIDWHWSSDDIVLDAELEIFLTPKEEKTMQQRKEDALALFNIVGPLPETDRGAMLRYGLEEMGIPRSVVMEIVKTQEQQQMEAQGELQKQAEQQAVAQGQMPNPTNLPGPMAGADLNAAVNPGEIPPGVAAGGAGAAPGSEDVIAQLLQ